MMMMIIIIIIIICSSSSSSSSSFPIANPLQMCKCLAWRLLGAERRGLGRQSMIVSSGDKTLIETIMLIPIMLILILILTLTL